MKRPDAQLKNIVASSGFTLNEKVFEKRKQVLAMSIMQATDFKHMQLELNLRQMFEQSSIRISMQDKIIQLFFLF